jgi:hypothetical protein
VPGPLPFLIACIVVLAAWLVTHVALVVACVRTESLSSRDRWLAIVPPITAWFGWRTGHRRTVIGWACLIVLYLVLRVALSVR